MNTYYVGLDVHQASICIAVLNAEGKLVMESVVETSAATILERRLSSRWSATAACEENCKHARLNQEP